MASSRNDIPTTRLNDGHAIPQVGLGVWRASDEEAAGAVRDALDRGERLGPDPATFDFRSPARGSRGG